ncbi:hypothetical protein G7085_05920 [Tessaracoccus sp. HDW20]|uniref:hypothetical protein n=1 Tax=Tessaracoccus coleopterorum TaxID=2714950 RepID=UPI0018D47C28|nr:hypothetical protein [Tessaracoccus coleopterorum]NHB84302.1 hypothetical protein [Tessaracoccus coleopterorum]
MKNGSKACALISVGIPWPVSLISTTTHGGPRNPGVSGRSLRTVNCSGEMPVAARWDSATSRAVEVLWRVSSARVAADAGLLSSCARPAEAARQRQR